MSRRGSFEVLADTDLFFFYLRGGKLEAEAAAVFELASSDRVSLKTSSEVCDDAITALRSDGRSLELAFEFVSAMRSLPHVSVAMNGQIASDALSMYLKAGGGSRLSYFDSFHVATAKDLGLPLLTSDGYILKNAGALGVNALDLATWKGPG